MGNQLPLIAAVNDQTGDGFVRVLRDVVDRIGLKQAAYELDVAPSLLANALAGRNHNYVRVDWLPWIVRQDKTNEALVYLADLAGYDLVPQRELTEAEELAALRDVVRESLGPELHDAVMAKARRRARESR